MVFYGTPDVRDDPTNRPDPLGIQESSDSGRSPATPSSRASGAAEQWIREAALELGFDEVGFARLDRPATSGAFLDWLATGRNAGMAYLERWVEKRLDPKLVLPGARSAVCVAQRYVASPADAVDGEGSPGTESAGSSEPLRVARYARGGDYHDSMLERLQRLEERLRGRFPEARTRRYVDTGPVLERDLAYRAGLGAFGKNTNLLHPELGSWFLLGEVLTTLELTPGDPVADLCGSCTACLDACPTGALPEPFVLDANRCISFWTIEHRGAIPEPVRGDLAGWLFGCDICQEVCPMNAAATPAPVRSELQPGAAVAGLTLGGLLRLDREAYVERFRGSPMKRAKLAGLKRNAALAMAATGDLRYVQVLGEGLADAEAEVRQTCAWALARLGGDAARGFLEARRESEADPMVRIEIHQALETSGIS